MLRLPAMESSGRKPSLPTTRRARVLLSLSSALLTFLVVLFCAEMGLRRHYGKIERITGVAPWHEADWEGLTYFWDVFHPDYGWSNLPGYRSDERVPFKIAINNQGLRAPHDYAERPTKGVHRIAIFGDSCVFGEEADDDQTLPVHLESFMKNTEVLNFGVHGFGLGQMVLRLEKEGFRYHPEHVVLVILLPSDITRDFSDFFIHSKPSFHIGPHGLEIDNRPVRQSATLPWAQQQSFAAAWLWGRPKRYPAELSLDEALKVPRALLDRATTACRRMGTELTLVTILAPGTIGLMQNSPEERESIRLMRDALHGMEIELIDLIPELEEAWLREGDTLAAPIAHWSDEGNRMIAKLLAKRMERATN